MPGTVEDYAYAVRSVISIGRTPSRGSAQQPIAIRSIIEQQFEQVRQAREHIVTLRDATTPHEPTPQAPTSVS